MSGSGVNMNCFLFYFWLDFSESTTIAKYMNTLKVNETPKVHAHPVMPVSLPYDDPYDTQPLEPEKGILKKGILLKLCVLSILPCQKGHLNALLE